jgi:hypothetical protein
MNPIRFSVLLLSLIAAAPGSGQEVTSGRMELYVLTGDRLFLAVPGTLLHAEVKRTDKGIWQLVNSGLINDSEWQKTWPVLLPQSRKPWEEILTALNAGNMSFFSFPQANAAFVLRKVNNNTVRLTIVTPQSSDTYAFTKADANAPWKKQKELPLESILAIEAIDRNASAAAQLFPGVRPPINRTDWGRFWDDLINKLSENKGKELVVYAQKDGQSGRVIFWTLDDGEWQKSLQGLQLGFFKALPPDTSQERPDQGKLPSTSSDLTLLKRIGGTTFLVIILLVMAAYLFRVRMGILLRDRIVRLAHRTARPPVGSASLEDLLGRIHQRVLENLMGLELPKVDRALRVSALAYVLGEYKDVAATLPPLRIALALTEEPHLAAGPESDIANDRNRKSDREKVDKREKKRGEGADISQFVMQWCWEREKCRDATAAQAFLARELERLDNLTEQARGVSELEERAAELAAELAEQVRLLSTDRDSFTKQLNRQQEKTTKAEADLGAERAAHQNTRNDRDAISKKLSEQQKEATRQLEEEKASSREALVGREREFKNDRKSLDDARAQALKQVGQLESELTNMRKDKEVVEGLAKKLETSLETERALHFKLTRDRKTLDEKMARITQASNYLRSAQKAYWDRCKHPASTGAILYNTYLGLFQAIAGATSEDATLESAGWTNLMNLLRRLAQVPGLEQYQKDFGPCVYPEIETIQVQGTVDSNQPDPERFVQSSVLQTLLSGEIQIDGDQRSRLSLDRLRGWPLYFRVDRNGVWGAT